MHTGLRYGEAIEVRFTDFHDHANVNQMSRRTVGARKKCSSMGRFRIDPGT